jgi:hypothetical protein
MPRQSSEFDDRAIRRTTSTPASRRLCPIKYDEWTAHGGGDVRGSGVDRHHAVGRLQYGAKTAKRQILGRNLYAINAGVSKDFSQQRKLCRRAAQQEKSIG